MEVSSVGVSGSVSEAGQKSERQRGQEDVLQGTGSQRKA